MDGSLENGVIHNSSSFDGRGMFAHPLKLGKTCPWHSLAELFQSLAGISGSAIPTTNAQTLHVYVGILLGGTSAYIHQENHPNIPRRFMYAYILLTPGQPPLA